jgi:glycosyltransferase involved in cell wall biosynthesis
MTPLLSIVTPVYERPALLRRAIESVLRQEDVAWEMVVVDDGSRQPCAPVVESYGDPRLRVLTHARNRGVSPARNTGVEAARGEWVVLLDSDDELVPGALATIRRRLREVGPDVGRLAFMYRVAEGGSSPEPALVEETWDYEGYVRWSASLHGRTDFSNTIRRSTFARLRFADDRSFEDLYHLDFARAFVTRTFPETVAVVHADAVNRTSIVRAASLLANAPDNARSRDAVLERHGEALRRVSPARYLAELRIAALHHFLAGHRLAGARHAARLARAGGLRESLRIGAVGLVGPRPLAALMALRSRRRAVGGEGALVRLAHVTTVPMTLLFLKGQAAFLRARGIETHAFSSPGVELEAFGREEEIPVHAVTMSRRISPLRDLLSLARLWWSFRRLRPAIVDAHTPKGGLLGLLAARAAGVPARVYHVHGLVHLTSRGLRRALLRTTERISCACATRVLCVSPSIARALGEEGLCPREKVGVLGSGSINGIDAARFSEPTPEQRGAAREALGIPPDATVLGFVGRLVRDKGILELAAAWGRLREEHPRLHLLVLGPEEGEDAEVRDAVRRLREDPRARCFGWDRDTPRYYRAMDVLALPSYREGFGLAALEASAMGLPVVATDIPGCVDAVARDRTGKLVPPRDAWGLAGAVDTYVSDPALRRAHGAAGRARAVREFEPARLWAALAREYEQLLSRPRGGRADAGSGSAARRGGDSPVEGLPQRL